MVNLTTSTSILSNLHANNNSDIDAFLDLLEADIKEDPNCLQAFHDPLFDRINSLVGDIDVDLNAPLFTEDE